MSDISYNFHRAILRRDGEIIAQVDTTVDRDGKEPLFFLAVTDFYAANGDKDARPLCITYRRSDAFRFAISTLEAIDGGKGGQTEVPPNYPGDKGVPVRYRGKIILQGGRAHVG